ncbi:MAG: hypothetical protein K8R87_04495 [Verrucomicrobia bacterium]|nr:hypothetical protein [Verrucomicrobiota bacterium]
MSTTTSPRRALFIMPLICALMSLLAIFGLSAMTIVPSAGAESFRGHMIFAAGALCVVWLCLAFWLRARSQASLPSWFSPILVVVSIFYVLGVFVFVIG